ncbi:hypothetical protein CANCADRAFT_138894 [Tortispora caseinolytica NRRL Y-17796]|uniref:Hsp90 chaperone protein kinase-targeting subunit n=1 Tax=Tortispora caseinolytica NRRL Y-17796 TaxID=767744 RepID=A0A1E4TCJ2_9ASCO|nr:hypothetical protein CANCADRAFT_138894 [Tortispora caseinolytica NRRL Y-17796]
MVLDYSKWDNLEISDDSDIEVHPNVDKASFIRWKQRDIHEKREQKKQTLQRLKVEEKLYPEFRAAVTAGIEKLEGVDGGKDEQLAVLRDCAPKIDSLDDQQTLTQMYGQLMEELAKSDNVKDALKARLETMDGYTKSRRETIEKLEKEENSKITMDGIHDKYNSTVVNKSASAPTASSSTKKTEQHIEVLNAPSVDASNATETNQPSETSYEPSKEGLEFAKIAIGDWSKSMSYILDHPQIVTEREKDCLLMHAFDLQLAGKPSAAKRAVHQGLLLQYCQQLGPQGIRVFFDKINKKNQQALSLFLDDVEKTYAHVVQRCEVISAEQQQPEGQEIIQLHTTDENTTINITVPPPVNETSTDEEKKNREIFESFPLDLQQAIESKDLKEVNKVLENMSVEDAEEVVNGLTEGGMLDIVEGIIDATGGETTENKQ